MLNTGLGDLEMAWKQKLGEGATSEFLGEFTEYPERYKAASPICLLPFKIPQVIVHGSQDDRVPLEMMINYVKVAKEKGDVVHFVEIKGGNHSEVKNPDSDSWKNKTLQLVKKLLSLK